jgi:hypothetical protein
MHDLEQPKKNPNAAPESPGCPNGGSRVERTIVDGTYASISVPLVGVTVGRETRKGCV